MGTAPSETTVGRPSGADLFSGYRPLSGVYDEYFDADGQPRAALARLVQRLGGLGQREFRRRAKLAEAALLRDGVTFSIYTGELADERIFPVDLVPRVVAADEWAVIERGLTQRVRALNAFLDDVYGAGRILTARPLLREMVHASTGYVRELRGVRPPGGVFVHIVGTDLIRDPDGTFRVLEDNLRVPSGVSYVLESRAVMKRVYPAIFPASGVRPVDEYPVRLRETLASLAHDGARVVVLTPGPHNSAYFEHSFLARRSGCQLAQGEDLFVTDDCVFMRTTHGVERVDVIYRRVDDRYLDPDVFHPDSLVGVPGLIRAYAAGNVVIANAPGNGVADDKAIYPFVPDMIRFYLGEDPLLDQVETFICARDDHRDHVLANLDACVVKAVDGAGGSGMLMGPQADRAELDVFRGRIMANPRGYIAQPRIELSTCPTWTGAGMAPRRVDLRPYVVSGRETWVLPGGLTRVALRDGSYVVNSSQGGGAKDTWVLAGHNRGDVATPVTAAPA
ncbi:MAG: circularly permuted type 2 ATP-grasp protein [Longimicrobiales bacterium]